VSPRSLGDHRQGRYLHDGGALCRRPAGRLRRCREEKAIFFLTDVRGLKDDEIGIAKAKERGVRFGAEPKLTDEMKQRIRQMRQEGMTVPAITKEVALSKASVYQALSV
jgi:Helix-turn-helix domain of resolvase